MRDAGGHVLGSPAEVAAEWERHFLAEFRHNVCLKPLEAVGCPAGFANLPPALSPLTVEEWTKRMLCAALWLRGGSVAGPDGLPPEAYRYAGSGLAQLLARISHDSFGTGAPDAGRGGRMALVLKGAGAVSTFSGARGVLWAAVSGKLFAKTSRQPSFFSLARQVGGV